VSALELVAEPLLEVGRTWDDAQREASDWLEALGLKREIWHAYPTTFSGGEQQKVNLARALIAPRRLLLLDEPTASLDAQAREALVARLAQLKTAGVAMIGVFHHPEDVRTLIDAELILSTRQESEVRSQESGVRSNSAC
jgi:alpha-D-ribose 1-methylphosphonate 5-triphosphate synthase subunit PhnL